MLGANTANSRPSRIIHERPFACLWWKNRGRTWSCSGPRTVTGHDRAFFQCLIGVPHSVFPSGAAPIPPPGRGPRLPRLSTVSDLQCRTMPELLSLKSVSNPMADRPPRLLPGGRQAGALPFVGGV